MTDSAVILESQDPDLPIFRQPEWVDRFPWIFQGTTGRGEEDVFDLGAFGSSAVGEALSRWKALREHSGFSAVVHSRQVHGTEIAHWQGVFPEGTTFVDGYDGHITGDSDLLLAVSVADCTPIFIVGEGRKLIAAVHAGWRGAADGALEKAVDQLVDLGERPEGLWIHLGPAICGECYEVGPEVHAALNPQLPVPTKPTPIDVRAALRGRAIGRGVPDQQVTLSGHCTRCGPGKFFSHRGGNPERQMGVIGKIA